MVRKPFLMVAFVCLFPLFVVYGQTVDSRKRYTILGLGDSITEGGEAFSCYLYPLWEKLFTGGYQVDFVGPRKHSCRIGELNHAGYSGKTAEYLESVIDRIYREHPADVVLLHAAHNHFADEKPIAGILSAYRSIICKVKAINPDVVIVVSQVIESGKLPKYSYIPELNKEIASMVSAFKDPRIVLADQATGFDWRKHTVNDKVHPNKEGAEHMAQVWYETLRKILPEPPQSFCPEIVTYKVAEGDSLKMHIFRPQKVKKEDCSPAIVYFFGGGWKLGTPLQFYRECAYYASLGLVAVTVDYRIAFLHRSTPEESLEDAKDAMCFLRSQSDKWGIDKKRMAASGASAGGYLAAAMGMAADNDKPCASPDLLILNYAVVERIKELKEDIPPVLFLVGSQDPLVPLSSVFDFQQKIEKQKGIFDLHVFEGAGHPIFYYRKDLDANFYRVRQLTDNFLMQHGYLKK